MTIKDNPELVTLEAPLITSHAMQSATITIENNPQLSTIQPGAFAGMTGRVVLSSLPAFTTLEAGTFADAVLSAGLDADLTGLTTIEPGAFRGMSSLGEKGVVALSGFAITELGVDAFDGMDVTHLLVHTMPNLASIKAQGSWRVRHVLMFANCAQLRELQPNAFVGLELGPMLPEPSIDWLLLPGVTFNGNPALSTIGSRAFGGVHFPSGFPLVFQSCNVSAIAPFAFDGAVFAASNASLAAGIDLRNSSLTSISQGAFAGATFYGPVLGSWDDRPRYLSDGVTLPPGWAKRPFIDLRGAPVQAVEAGAFANTSVLPADFTGGPLDAPGAGGVAAPFPFSLAAIMPSVARLEAWALAGLFAPGGVDISALPQLELQPHSLSNITAHGFVNVSLPHLETLPPDLFAGTALVEATLDLADSCGAVAPQLPPRALAGVRWVGSPPNGNDHVHLRGCGVEELGPSSFIDVTAQPAPDAAEPGTVASTSGFRGLDALALTTISAGAFKDARFAWTLLLRDNPALQVISAGAFDNTQLDAGVDLSSTGITAIPSMSFAGARFVGAPPAEVVATSGAPCASAILLAGSPVASIQALAFEGAVFSHNATLCLNGLPQLTTLQPNAFKGMVFSGGAELDISGAPLSALPAGAFAGVAMEGSLALASSALQSIVRHSTL